LRGDLILPEDNLLPLPASEHCKQATVCATTKPKGTKTKAATIARFRNEAPNALGG
jgi:hypothetical protein